MASVAAASYLVGFREGCLLPEDWEERLKDFYAQDVISVVKKTKKGEKELNLKESIYELAIREIPDNILMDGMGRRNGIYMLLNASSGGNIKPSFVLDTFYGTLGITLPEFGLLVHRIDTYKNIGSEQERKLVPLIWEK